ncbi:DNA-3-methyladenine glycosylase 2 family protein [bacterium]|nr:DNA-3-methyladenine glycosylase 2 family protein [bacterium]
MITLDEANLENAVSQLCEQDSKLATIVSQFGSPPLWKREPGFGTLVHIILEQQVSLASARTCFDKLNVRLPGVQPADFLTLSNAELLKIGFSRQKTRYTRILAQAVLDGALDINELNNLDDDEVFSRLTALTGIGPWTAKIYLLMALSRPDIWPEGDLALVAALQKLFNLDQRPDLKQFQDYGKNWRPYRAVAARILWHYYLSL